MKRHSVTEQASQMSAMIQPMLKQMVNIISKHHVTRQPLFLLMHMDFELQLVCLNMELSSFFSIPERCVFECDAFYATTVKWLLHFKLKMFAGIKKIFMH